MKRPHREVVGAAVMDRKLFSKIVQGEKAVTGIKTLLIFSVAALYFSVMTWRVRTDQLVTNPQLVSS